MELFSRSGSKYRLFWQQIATDQTLERVDASWLKLIYLEKNSDEYSAAFRSFAEEGGHPRRYEEMVGLCEFRGFIAIITTISNNTRTHGVCCQ